MRMRTAWRLAFILALPACEGETVLTRPLSGASLDRVFASIDTLVLPDTSLTDPIGGIGSFHELPDGSFLIGDHLLPRVRHYAPDGTLLAAAGRYGSGPAELRSVGGISYSDGLIFLTDPQNGRIQVYEPDLTHRKTIRSDLPTRSSIVAIPGGFLVSIHLARDGDSFAAIDEDGTPRWTGLPPDPRIVQEAYWGSASRLGVTRIGNRVVVSDGLLYPLKIVDLNGATVDSIDSPPPSYVEITSVGNGAFVGRQVASAIQAWFDQFTAIGGVYTLGDSALVVVSTRLTSTPSEMVGRGDYAIDVYDAGFVKRYEDVPLPPGARVIGGGQSIYALLSEPPEPWRILRMTRLRE